MSTPQRPGSPTPQQPATPPRPRFRISWRWIVFFLILLGINYWIGSRATQPATRIRVPYSPFFLDQIRGGDVVSITSKGTAIQGTFKKSTSYAGSKPSTRFSTEIPAFADTKSLSNLLEQKGVVVNAKPLTGSVAWWENLLLGFGPTLLFIGLLVLLMRRAGNAQGVLGSFGRSRAKRYEPTGGRVTFADVAGIDEAKDELSEVVDFLRQPEKYQKLGARIPHGVLLSGPPGTGKTLLARAVAGEANVPFFSLSASEFVEAIVGIGAARVRDLFEQAKTAAPAIVFIDELDAIGRSRTSGVAGFSGGNDEREQTLNQILTEMDGFSPTTSVIVIAATNRPDVLDQALLRPGRFDRRVAVQPPDRTGREAILKVHTRGVPIGPDVDLGRIASSTPGMVGADLANLVNEAALLAARRGHEQVLEADFTDALERIILGAERKVMISVDDRRRTAYHEGGHALVGMLTPGADLANLVNEAALLAARRGHEFVQEADFTDALERIVLGAERKVMISVEDRRRTAYHEGGHALVGMLTPGADPVRKISVIPRGMALGVTFSAPDVDRFNYDRPELLAKIKVALGGRGAEEIVYGEPTTGAESDIQQLTQIARQMVGRWGMSDRLGPLTLLPSDGSGPLLPGASEVSPRTQELIDEEVRRIVEAAYKEVLNLLTENRRRLDSLAAALVEHETLDEDDAYAAAGVPHERRPADAKAPLAAAIVAATER